jgi:hypothetical protein
MNEYGHFYRLTMGGFGLVIGFNEILRPFSTNNYNSLAGLHNLQITIAHVNLLSLLRCHQSLPDDDLNVGDSSAPVFHDSGSRWLASISLYSMATAK